ncbi:MAG: Fic family protein [Patescibacteria group bacterium]|jgi:Fic family protein|nr:Fic family protein [Patescibacteria group bacterium]
MNINRLNNRQIRIIEFAEKIESFQIKDLLVSIKEEFEVERLTIVRDLSLLTKELILIKKGKGRNTFYQISKKYLLIKEYDVDKYFSVPHNKRDVNPFFNKEVVDLLKSDIFSEEEIIRLEKAKIKYAKTIKLLKKESPTIFKKEWERLIIELSWKSSEIEGNTYTLLETEFLIKDLALAEGKEKAEAQMILNHKKVLDLILLKPEHFKGISIDKIKEIHSLLVQDIGIKTDFRNHPVGITGTLYRPLSKKNEIEKNVHELVKRIEETDNHFLKAFIFLIMIAYIQPFEDGNKRTSRIIANAILHANNSPMLSYRDVNATEYKKAILLFYEQNNISYIKKIFIEQIEFSVNNYFK